jgi:regulator of sigma E protease
VRGRPRERIEARMMTLLAFVVVLGVVIFVHELGHFLAAKAVGIRVERFSIGYPPRAIGRKIGETDYCLSWIPFGGYVKMSGMIDESLDGKGLTGAPYEFMSKNTGQKVLAITAGVLMNFLLAAGIYSVVTLSQGIPYVNEPVVETVSPGLPADAAGIEAGDRILSIGGRDVPTWAEMVEIIHASPEQPLAIRWDHEGEAREAEITPQREKTLVDGDLREVGLIGISPRFSYRPAGFFEAVFAGGRLTVQYLQLGLKSLGMVVTGQASIKDLGGPIAIAKYSGESAKGGATSLILFIAFISINIGLLNLLPVPALDGGHLAIILIEGATRRPLSTRVKLVVQQVGMVLLLGLMAVVIFNDLGRVGVWEKIRGLF